MDKPFETLLAEAIRAPSGDNTQPWQFVVDVHARRIALYVDESRDPSPMNSGQRMSRMAVGAALENLLRTAKSRGWSTELEEPRNGASAVVRLSAYEGRDGEIEPAIAARVTNRRRYDGRPLAPEILGELQSQTPQLDGVRTCWICERERINSLAALVGRADAVMLGEPSMRRAFLENVRFDAPWDAEVKEGLPLASLELSAADRVGLRMMGRIPDWLLKVAGAKHIFSAAARKLVASASGLCLVVEEDGTPQSEVLAGRAAQRAWLALTAAGLAVQPMMSLAILESVLCRGAPDLQESLGRAGAMALIKEFRALAPEIAGGNTAFIMRFGFAPPPTARTGRLTPAVLTKELLNL